MKMVEKFWDGVVEKFAYKIGETNMWRLIYFLGIFLVVDFLLFFTKLQFSLEHVVAFLVSLLLFIFLLCAYMAMDLYTILDDVENNKISRLKSFYLLNGKEYITAFKNKNFELCLKFKSDDVIDYMIRNNDGDMIKKGECHDYKELFECWKNYI